MLGTSLHPPGLLYHRPLAVLTFAQMQWTTNRAGALATGTGYVVENGQHRYWKLTRELCAVDLRTAPDMLSAVAKEFAL
jgi:hypothetical protein